MTEALYDANAEQAVLGAILIDGSIIGKIREIVSYKDFYDSNYSLIFRAMEWLNNNNVPIDLVTLSDALGRVGGLERVNGSSGLAELAGGAITPIHAESYARLVAEYSGKRSVGNLAKDISTLSQNKAPLPEIIDAVKDKVEKINQKNNKQSKYEVVPMTDFIDAAENRYRLWGKMQGLSTGFSNIDRLTLGLVGGELIIIAGQTSRGKTLLSMNIANNVAKTGRIVLFVTLEMTHVELTSRYMYLNGEESKDFIEVSTNTLFQKNDELGWKDIDGLIRNAKEELGADLVVVDHLHYFTRETDKASEDLGRITKEFKKNAIRHNIPIILVSHVRKLGKDEKLSGESLRGCLPEDERVLTDRGNIPIKDVKVGDKVLSVSQSRETVESSVTAVWETGEKEILEMTLNDGRKIRSSSEHRFLTPLGFWEAGELHRGCPLVGLADLIPGREFKETMRQFGIQSVCSVGVMKTYDLEVSSTHNYVVNGIITHNSSYIAQDADIVLLVDRDPKNNDMGVMIDKNRNRGKLSDRVKSWGDMTEREINTVYLEFNNTRLKEKLQ